jgi:hypothetical protein
MVALRVAGYFPYVLIALGLNNIQAHMLVRNAMVLHYPEDPEDLDPPSAPQDCNPGTKSVCYLESQDD